MALSQISAIANESQTTNILTNGSFDNQTEGWTLDGTASYDGNNYGNINKSVRFSGVEGGSVTQEIILGNISAENKEVTTISGSLISIGCNNEGSSWCTETGTANNLDPVNITMTLSDGTNTEVLTHNFTSDYNDGVITTNYSVNVVDTFETDSTSLTINYFGADTGDKAGKFGSILDDLSLTLTLNDITIVQELEIAENELLGANTTVMTATELSEATIDDISSGIIDIGTNIDQSTDLASSISVVSIQDLELDVADVSTQMEMPVLVDTGVDNLEGDISIPEPDLPKIELPEIELPDIELPNELPEIENIEIESIEINETESDLDSDIESDIEETIEETPAELEEQNLEEDLEEIESEESENENESENEGDVEKNDDSKLSRDDKPISKSTETKKEQKTEKKIEVKKEQKNREKQTVPKVKSDIVVKTLELPTVVAFSEIYFANTYKDTLDLGADEVEFYEPDRFTDNKDYSEANIAFLNISSDSNSEWDMVVESTKFRIKEFKRDGR